LVTPTDLWVMAGLDLVVAGVGLGLYRQLVAVCFDEEFARLRGLATEAYFLLLLMLTALTVVVLAQVVGIILVIALLTLPAAMAGHWARRLWQIMAGAVAISAAATTGGLALAYGPDWPAGAVIIVLTGAAYLALAAATGLGGRR
jgi:zinc transport system permease protein